jgi:phosphoribosylformylglycinamidine synthase
VSFYNESGESYVPPTASLLGIGLMEDASRAVTSDLKRSADRLYLVGSTRDQMAGSALYARHGAHHSAAPNVDLMALSASVEAMLEAHSKGWIEAAHDVSDGGLAVTLAEMCIGGQLGAEVDLSKLVKLRPAAQLFSESNSRWVIEVGAARAKNVESLFKRHGVALAPLGRVKAPPRPKSQRKGKGKKGAKTAPDAEAKPARLRITSGKKVLLDITVEELEDAWTRPFWDILG